ncbi:MAG: hypothetical protein ABJU84_12430 [Cyclobacteriaceae bacterium]
MKKFILFGIVTLSIQLFAFAQEPSKSAALRKRIADERLEQN